MASATDLRTHPGWIPAIAKLRYHKRPRHILIPPGEHRWYVEFLYQEQEKGVSHAPGRRHAYRKDFDWIMYDGPDAFPPSS